MATRIRVALFLAFFLVFFLSCSSVKGSYQLGYVIEVHKDGSATWVIKQKGTDVPASFAAFDIFVKNTSFLVNLAKEKTQRDMFIEGNPKMNVSFFDSYKVVTYEFLWNGFAEVEDGQIIIGDVFLVENFFSYLYGDGAITIFYPSEYTVESISPQPHEWKESIRRLEWYGIESFKPGEPKISLNEKSAFSRFIETINRNSFLVLGLLLSIIAGSTGLYYFRFRKTRKDVKPPPEAALSKSLVRPDDEEKVISLLKAAGGTMYQSVITDQCGFSRSKTSKLLKEMENKGRIKREDKGREKIVILLENIKETGGNKK